MDSVSDAGAWFPAALSLEITPKNPVISLAVMRMTLKYQRKVFVTKSKEEPPSRWTANKSEPLSRRNPPKMVFS